MTDTVSGSASISRFGAFALDADQALLTQEGAAVALRPKTFALLSYLARHPGRVLTKEELLGAVWPGVVVNDESLSQCVRELRVALGDGRQALIRTVPRRGYLFDPTIAAQAPPSPPADSAKPHVPRAWRPLWVLAGAALIAGALVAVLLQRSRAPDPPLDTRRSIAVLPFAELGASSLIGDAVAEDLTIQLGRRSGMLVISFASAAALAAREPDRARIARALGVRHLVTGSVQREGAAVEVSAQLVAADDGALLWAQRWRYPSVADWAWQRDLGAGVAGALGLPAAPNGTISTDPPNTRLEAFDAILKGRHQMRQVAHLVDLRRARAHFEQALAIEPDAASAWVWLARTHLDEIELGWSNDRASQLAQAEQVAARALQLACESPPALGLNTLALMARGDLDAALAGFQLGVGYNPNWAWGHARIAALKLRLGRPEEVLVHADMALRLSPFEPTLVGYSHLWAGVAEFYLGREDAAYERMRQSADAGPNPSRYGALLWLASLAALHGREAQAAQHAASVMQLDPGWTIAKWRRVTALTHPRLVTGRERFAEGLKKAGLPE